MSIHARPPISIRPTPIKLPWAQTSAAAAVFTKKLRTKFELKFQLNFLVITGTVNSYEWEAPIPILSTTG